MKPLKKTAHKLFHLIGRDFLPYTAEYFAVLRRKKIIASQQISLVLDIGANKGTYAQEIRESDFSGRIVSFEPLANPFLKLKKNASKDPFWNCEHVAVGNEDKDTSMTVSGRETSSSLLSMTQTHLDAMPSSAPVGQEKVKVARLDSFYDKYVQPEDRIYMKIDVQGYEREVLDGSPKTLKNTHAIEIELSTVPMYDGAPVMSEMLIRLEKLGYTLVSIELVFADLETGHMLQADGIFVRN